MQFQKFQAAGNDFLIVRKSELPVEDSALTELVRRMCDRHRGPGADGVEVLLDGQPLEADFRIRIFNADGGETPISGNGTRCMAAYLYLNDCWSEPLLRIETRAGVKTLSLKERGETHFVFETEMGKPRLSSAEIPLVLPHPQSMVIAETLEIEKTAIVFTASSMGNPHCTVLVDRFDTLDWQALGAAIEHHSVFPDRTNVEFVRVLDRDRIEVRFWERGVGPTLSSGTGSCAAAIACILNQKTDRRVRVLTEGGELIVEWLEDGRVLQEGAVDAVYYGATFSK